MQKGAVCPLSTSATSQSVRKEGLC